MGMTDKLDETLHQLAIAAQNYPVGTPERQRTVHQLILNLQTSGRLCRPRCPRHLLGSYEEIHAIALQNLFKYLYQKIELYQRDRGTVLQWCNYLLTQRFPDAIREVQSGDYSLDKIEIPDSKPSLEIEEVLDVLKENPDKIFTKLHVTDHPNANFQFVATQVLSGYRWEEIADRLEIKISTVSSFYQRSLKKLAPQLKQYLLS